MLRNLATSLINARDERIVTTLPKAKELRPFVERVITLSRHAQVSKAITRRLTPCICAGRPPRSFIQAIASRSPQPDGAELRARRALPASLL
jgi:large subunit ribosomal protein L17